MLCRNVLCSICPADNVGVIPYVAASGVAHVALLASAAFLMPVLQHTVDDAPGEPHSLLFVRYFVSASAAAEPLAPDEEDVVGPRGEHGSGGR